MAPPGSVTAEAQLELAEAKAQLERALEAIQSGLASDTPVMGFIEKVSHRSGLDEAVVQQALWMLLAQREVELLPDYMLARAKKSA